MHIVRQFVRVAATYAALAVLLAAGAAAPAKAAQASGTATVEEAAAFMQRAEQRLLELWVESERAAWVQSNFITDDTERIAAAAQERVIAATMDLAAESTRFDSLELAADLARKMRMLKTSLPLVAPRDAAKQAELSLGGASAQVANLGRLLVEARRREA